MATIEITSRSMRGSRRYTGETCTATGTSRGGTIPWFPFVHLTIELAGTGTVQPFRRAEPYFPHFGRWCHHIPHTLTHAHTSGSHGGPQISSFSCLQSFASTPQNTSTQKHPAGRTLSLLTLYSPNTPRWVSEGSAGRSLHSVIRSIGKSARTRKHSGTHTQTHISRSLSMFLI